MDDLCYNSGFGSAASKQIDQSAIESKNGGANVDVIFIVITLRKRVVGLQTWNR